ncbi:MAG: hypothetical protein F4211_06780 [Acidimicrobiia bacterium]|nr:hypothetical protein [Acidimicrobiia bacterium]
MTQDKRLRHGSAEKRALIDNQVRLFSMTGHSLEADEVAQHFLNNLDDITQACREPGPFVYVVYPDRIERLKSI